MVASRPDHFKRSLRFKGFLNLAISDSVNDVMQNQDSSSLFEEKRQNTPYPYGVAIVVQKIYCESGYSNC